MISAVSFQIGGRTFAASSCTWVIIVIFVVHPASLEVFRRYRFKRFSLARGTQRVYKIRGLCYSRSLGDGVF